MFSRASGLAVTTLAVALSGCFHPEAIKPEQLERGYILLLPGVENTPLSMAGIHRGLRDAGIDQAMDLDLWGYYPFGTFRNLMALELNRQRAARIAGKVAAYRRDHRSRPISVVGFSGGGAMALFVAEALPKDVAVDRVVLLGAAISPRYDLSAALGHCSQGMVNFYSEYDWFMGGLATQVFGTMDREKTSTAGRVGFLGTDGKRLERAGLTQIGWTWAWWKLGHDGGHGGWSSRQWARTILAPLIAGNAPARPAGKDEG